MYHNTKESNAHYGGENQNQKSKDKHSHSAKKKLQKRKKGKLPSKINSAFEYADSTSDYIGPERLTTKHMGFLTKGKISDPISRLERIVPDYIKARSDQDLHKILHCVNGTRNSQGLTSLFQTSTHKTSSQTLNPNLSKTPTHFSGDLWKQKLENSIGSVANRSVFSSVKTSLPQINPLSEENELFTSSETIIKNLHPAIICANNLLFPGISNKDRFKHEALLMRKRFNACKSEEAPVTHISEHLQDNYCTVTSSASGYLHDKSIGETSPQENFELNPVLTEESNEQEDFIAVFPSIPNFTDDSQSEEYTEEELDVDPPPLLKYNFDDYEYFSSKASASSSKIENHSVSLINSPPTLICSSPTSSNGSPVWKPKISPVKFFPDSPPTPQLFFRQKMF